MWASQNVSHTGFQGDTTPGQSQTVTTYPSGPFGVQTHISQIETLHYVQTTTHITETLPSSLKLPNKYANLKLLAYFLI
jgi:hypothetical protein